MLAQLNERLRAGKPRAAIAPTGDPMLFVVGCARSGSTLMLQWLSASGVFACPTNIVSRFPGDPAVGALVHRALYELDDRGEVFPDRDLAPSFRSTLGRAQGPAEPHDFGYLWKSAFAFGATQDQLTQSPTAERLEELASDVRGMQAVFGKPFAMKALQLNWHIPLLAGLFPEAVLLHVHRDPLDNAHSLLQARREYFGDEHAWYSFRPPQYDEVRALPPWEQCVAQVVLTEQAVRQGLSTLPEDRVIEVAYADLCDAPSGVWPHVMRSIGRADAYTGPDAFHLKRHTHAADLVARATAVTERYAAA
ncbi:MAG: sulfotransferase [Flavobacteriales bacterium]|nr:sulfotransferase [Flavobacteriales bacterium]